MKQFFIQSKLSNYRSFVAAKLSNRKFYYQILFFVLATLFCQSTFGQITGKAFRDFDGNGTQQAGEPGVSNIIVNFYLNNLPPEKDEYIGQTTTTIDGSYSFNPPSYPVRIEFETPEGFCSLDPNLDFPASNGNLYGTSVQFATSAGVFDYILNYPADFALDQNPLTFTTCFINGDPLAAGNSATSEVLVGMKYNYSGDGSNSGYPGATGPPHDIIGNADQLGSIWGIAISRQSRQLFTTSFMKRHSGFGPLGSGGIYMVDIDDYSTSYNYNWLDFDSDLGIPTSDQVNPYITALVGTNVVDFSPVVGTNAQRGLSPTKQDPSADPAAYEQVGKISFGDIDISEDGRFLYVVNLYDRKLYQIDLVDPYNPQAPTLADVGTLVKGFDIPNPCSGNQGEHRPFALKVHRGKVYVGTLCSGQNSSSQVVGGINDLEATVYEFDMGTEVFDASPVIQFPLNYRESSGQGWRPWKPQFEGGYFEGPGFPMISDIEFDGGGNMQIALMDRRGHQMGWQNWDLHGNGNYSIAAVGDILKAARDVSAMECEYTIQFVPEFYKDTHIHLEPGTGGLSVHKTANSDNILATFMDPIQIWSGGTMKFDNKTGNRLNGYTIYYQPGGAATGPLGKAHGIGDIEALQEVPLIEIGNSIWVDKDKDGVQDPDEQRIPGVIIELLNSSGDVIATTISDEDGEYYFNYSNVMDPAAGSTGVTGPLPYTDYKLRISPTQFTVDQGVDGGPLEDMVPTLLNSFGEGILDISDNDAVVIDDTYCINYQTGQAGANDHSLDFGLAPLPDLALTHIVDPSIDYSSLEVGDSIKFKMYVCNQSELYVDSLVVTDYIPAGYSFDPTIVGNEIWTFDGGSNTAKASLIDLVGLTTDSLCIYLRLTDRSVFEDLINVAEISYAEDINGVSLVNEDIDSVLDDDPTNNGGSQYDTPADDYKDGDGTSMELDGIAATDQDNVDPAAVPICDLALINKLDSSQGSYAIGDTVKFLIEIENQGTILAKNIKVNYQIPEGLVYIPSNNNLSPNWMLTGDVAMATITDDLPQSQKDTICIYLTVDHVNNSLDYANAWTTIAEIASYTDRDLNVKGDLDSNPDNNPGNDPGGNVGDDTDDETNGDGTGDPMDPAEDSNPDLDEDDHDPAIVYICDVATIIDIEESGPFNYGDELKYFVIVSNQGNGDITNIDVQNLFGEGLEYVDNASNTAEGWTEEGDGELGLLITDVIGPGDSDTICLYMKLVPDYESDEGSWVQNVEVVSFEDPSDPGVSKTDIDSNPDNIPDNDPGGNPNDEDTDDVTDGDGSGDPTDEGEDTDPMLDEDDQDVEDIDICDLALINTIVELNDPPRVGDTVKFEVIVVNQGNVGANSVNLDYLLPNGFTYLPVNDGLDPAWVEESSVLISSTTTTLAPGESDTLCLYLQLENIPTDEVTEDSWTTISEITDYVDEDGVPKVEDIDSSPDDNLTDDPGGNPGDDTDDELEGDGTGDPMNPAEDSDPDLDEDDNDPAIVYVCDVATIIFTEVPDDINYYDTLKYYVEISNQGNGDITNILVADHLPEGLEFIETASNLAEGWEESATIDEAITVLYDEILMSGESDTICLELRLVPVHEDSDESSWNQVAEVVQFESPDDIGVPKNDLDSNPDDDPSNDPGGNPDDDTDDETDGDGTGDPDDMTEDSDPLLDEDDNDAVDTKVFDLALTMQIDSMPPVLPVIPGDILKFIVVVYNQGNTPANEVEITNYLMDENLVLASVPGNDEWESVDSERNEYVIEEAILPGVKDTICIYLEVIGGAMTDIVTYSEISGSIETDGDCYDIDSTPDDILIGDPGGNPETDEDDHIEDDGEDGNEDGITDEDDHDPAMLDGQDLALIIWADQKEPVVEGDDVKFIIRVTNQGNITNENIKIVNYLPDGLELSENDDNGWEYDEMNENHLVKTLDESLGMDEEVETCLILTVQQGTNAIDLINYAEIVSSNSPEGLILDSLDIDSYPNNVDDDDTGGVHEDMPDCSTDPVIINDDNYIDGAGVIGEDEDDHDPAWVHVFDLASIIYTDRTVPVIPGDEIKFNVEVHNQGNMTAKDIDLVIYMPDGFILSENDTNWTLVDGVLESSFDRAITPNSVDTICLILEVLPDVMLLDLIPIVEITGAMDTLGNERNDFDLDSKPNESAGDDEGGEIFTDDDDNLDGNGEIGDDEDDHDPAVPPVMDLAIKIITVDESPKKVGDIVKFSIMVFNQGSMTPSEFTIENYVPEGLIFLDIPDNDGWMPSGPSNATYIYDEDLYPLTSDTLCIYLKVAPGANPKNVVDMVEIIQIIDQMDNDVSLLDIDSESDNSNENDVGNDLYSAEDNKTDENGRSGEDEDDHDQAFVNMCQGISCNGHMNISVDQNCETEITPSVVLTGDIFPDHIYEVTITNSEGEVVSNMFGGDDIGELFTVSVSNPLCNNNSCWMTILIEDKWAPQIICQNDTLSCSMAFDESTKPTLIDDNCSGGELILIDEIFEPLNCDTMFTSRLTRVWTATDAAGNMADTCTQVLSLLRTNLDSIMPVMNFMLATNNAISCSSGYETDANGHPAPSLTGVPKLRLENGEFLDLYPFDGAVICNGYVEYSDEVLQGSTDCVTKILRTWIVGEWWCSETNQREFIQLIEVVDFEGPSVTCPQDLTISTSGFSCEGYIGLELPVVSDACNGDNIRIDLSAPTSPSGFIKDYDGGIIELPVGVNELTYRVYDDCGNRTDCMFRVTVRDHSDPIAICDQFTAIGFGLEDLTKVSAEAIDDGSFDECGPVSLAVARMDDPGFEDFSGFGPDVDITCEDIGTNVMVGLLVTDEGGNTNMCMVSIEVQDKIDAQFTCPSDVTVACNYAYDPSNLGAFFGEVVIYDNCPASNTVDDKLIGSLNSCGAGVLIREIRLLNAQGEQVDYCTQEITFRKGTTLQYSDITPPVSEVTVSGCGIASIDPSVLGMPIVPDNECQQAAISITNDTFPFTSNGACLKIIRTFKVIDWCIDDGPGSILEPFEFTQTIKVNNTVGPEIENVFADSVFCSYSVGCIGININNYLTATSSDDCTAADDLLNKYEVRNSDGNLVKFGAGLDASGFYDIGEYTVRFISEDKCGNQVFEESTFEVRSCKLPTAYCLQGLSTTLTAMDTTGDGTADIEMVMLPVDFFDAGSYHPCGYDIQLSFSADLTDTVRSFFCSDTVGLQPIELWVTDEFGSQDYCTTFVDVQDNDTIDLCGGMKPVDIAGRVYTEVDAELHEAEVELKSSESIITTTDENGMYEFADMPQGGNYQVAPHKDDDHMNGVSTLDLVMIQRHILGIAPLNSVYKMIAADINNNEKISASDLVALRKVILGIEHSFPNNRSWRFIDAGFEFVNEANPWEEPIDESYDIIGLSDDMQIDFVALKTGDVNGNVDMNIDAGIVIESRSNSTLTLAMPNIKVARGNLYEVEVKGTEDMDIYGMQLSLSIDGLELINILPGKMDVRKEFMSTREEELHLSYASANGDEIKSDDVLYTFVFKATEDGQLSEMIEISSTGINAESYHGEELAIGGIEISWRESENANLVELLKLEGNSPNPWKYSTELKFYLPSAGKVNLIVKDGSGRLLINRETEFASGQNNFTITSNDIEMAGVFLYELRFEGQIVNGKMIRIK